MEDVEKGVEDDEEDERNWDGVSNSNSNTPILPKKRMKHKQMKIENSVLQSMNESSRLNDMMSNKLSAMTPSIRKALNERANFYRRKLTFYEDLGILATSMTSQEI